MIILLADVLHRCRVFHSNQWHTIKDLHFHQWILRDLASVDLHWNIPCCMLSFLLLFFSLLMIYASMWTLNTVSLTHSLTFAGPLVSRLEQEQLDISSRVLQPVCQWYCMWQWLSMRRLTETTGPIYLQCTSTFKYMSCCLHITAVSEVFHLFHKVRVAFVCRNYTNQNSVFKYIYTYIYF